MPVKKRLTVDFPAADHKALKRLALELDIDMADVVKAAVYAAIDPKNKMGKALLDAAVALRAERDD